MMEALQYRAIEPRELTRGLFAGFQRRQVVDLCWRRQGEGWVIRPDPFVDDWSEEDYGQLLTKLRAIADGSGLVYGAFVDGALKGFAAVDPTPFGPEGEYLDLAELHVSQELRGRGIGTALLRAAAGWARAHGAGKLYLSAHSAHESQAFYRGRGCVDATHPSQAHVDKEPFDCQLELPLD